MHDEANDRGSAKADRVELILRELESLPTLGSVAVRLLELTADADAKASEVIQLVSCDPALASRVLKLCRCHERGRAANVTSVDRAVLLLGFEAVRCAALSVQIFEVMDRMGSPGGEAGGTSPVFDREAFWLHALGVAVTSEQIAARGTLTRDIRPSDAFIAGLLHDLGQLVLHVLLPESFDQVCRVAETHGITLDRACRQIIGLDTHTPGKRLAESWGLPRQLVDVIWLNGQSVEALPHVPDRTLVCLVTLADALVRSRYITPGAHWSPGGNVNALCVPIGISPADLEGIARGLHDEVSKRAAVLGLNQAHDHDILLRSICRANESLARANAGMRQREQLALRQTRTMKAMAEFQDSLPAGGSMVDVLGCIAASAATMLETPVAGAAFASGDGHGWRLIRFSPDQRPFGCCTVEPPDGALPFEAFVATMPASAHVATLMPWLGEYLPPDVDFNGLGMLGLFGEGAGRALLLLESPVELSDGNQEHSTLTRCWRAALAAAAERDAAAHVTEELAEANRALLDAQEALARSRTMSTLGEVAAGAAHEMNNPLTIISGRGQILATRLQDPEHHQMAQDIVEQAHRLSDMITALRSFAEPLAPRIESIDLADLVMRVVQEIGVGRRQTQIDTIFARGVPEVHADPKLLRSALSELIRNAIESKGSRHIELRVQTDPTDDRLKIEVRDDGDGLDEHTLRHAFDPFFSAQPAGRRPGLGLARTRRAIEAQGGRISLANGPDGGAVATVWLSGWRGEADERREAA
jgi:signal transduction histidine kinase/HD-like signal output (HDOD) protein